MIIAIEELLNDKVILEQYKKIELEDNEPFTHAIQHIKNVLELSDKLIQCFDLNENDAMLLKIAIVLHDVGLVYGRDKHPTESEKFARQYLKKYDLKDEDLEIICSAILTHDDKEFGLLKNNIAWYLNFIDKMDITYKRLREEYKDKLPYSEIRDISFEIKDDSFLLNIQTFKVLKSDDVIRFEDMMNIINDYFSFRFFDKVINITRGMSNHFNLDYKILIDGREIKIKN